MKTILLLLFPFFAIAQSPIITSYSHLRIPSSSRGLSMGDCGIASASGNQQLFYNAAKSAFTQNFHQASVNYTPWMSGVSNETRFLNVNYLGSINNTSSLGLSLNYLNLGTLETRDNNGATIADYKAREYSFGTSYALQINENNSVGVALRFLGQNTFTDAPKNAYSLCGDVSYYGFMNLGDINNKIEWGAVISNIGPKQGETYLPTNFGIGIGYTSINDEDGSQLTVGMDINKLLVSESMTGGILSNMFSSFTDPSPIQLLRLSTGIEYGFMNEFFLRGGVSLENQNKGNRKYFGLGVGYKGLVLDQSVSIDFHYLVPFGTVAAVSPFQNSFGFSLALSFGNFQ